MEFEKGGWGGRIRTYGTRYQKALPYRLATPQLRDVVRCSAALIKAKKQIIGGLCAYNYPRGFIGNACETVVYENHLGSYWNYRADGDDGL